MIYLSRIDLAFGGDPLFTGLTWTIKPGQRIGLIGPNGAGKSTLLKVVTGRQRIDGGTVTFDGGTTVGYLAQDVQELDLGRTVLEEALQAFAATLALEDEETALLTQMETLLAQAVDPSSRDYMRLLERQHQVHTELAAAEAHLLQPRTEAILSGLGFSADEMRRPLASFSGGWRMRVALAQLLLQRPSVLLLDEPTNHLDIESIDWLEGYLQTYPGAVVLVSHDRYFLDRMITTTAELANGQVTDYAGNYTFYLEARQERRTLQQAAYDNQQKMIADTERFIERFRYKATKAVQVQSRIKQLEKLERVVPPPQDAAVIHFRFPAARSTGRIVQELSPFSKTYPTPEGTPNPVFDAAGPLVIERGDKVALIGKNGAGKSTLARILLGQEDFDGTRTVGYQVDPAYFAQHQADELNPTLTVLDGLREKARGQSDTELRSLLGAFLFVGDDVFKPVGVLSGGERSRLALARTMLDPANFLVLDEPTNHLDLASKAVLVEALTQYTGSFVVVSHDRYFLDQIVNRVWYVEDHTVRVYSGTYTEAQWLRTHGTAAKLAAATPKAATPKVTAPKAAATHAEADAPKALDAGGKKSKEDKRREAEARNQLYRLLKDGGSLDVTTLPPDLMRPALDKLEGEIAQREEARAVLEQHLADPDVYQDSTRFAAILADFNAADKHIQTLYARWEALAAHAETLGV